jgi:chromosome segregation ATPase
MNLLYPGLPDYTGPTKGWFTLLHHEGPLVEYSQDVMERIRYINREKSAAERPIRLRHIVYVPMKMIPKKWQKADAKWEKADAEWQKADAEWQKADAEWQKTDAEWQKTDAEWQKADAECEKADAPQILAYLKQHVTDCKWNGKELEFS